MGLCQRGSLVPPQHVEPIPLDHVSICIERVRELQSLSDLQPSDLKSLQWITTFRGLPDMQLFLPQDRTFRNGLVTLGV